MGKFFRLVAVVAALGTSMLGFESSAGALVNKYNAHFPIQTGCFWYNNYCYTYRLSMIPYSVDVAPGTQALASQIDQAAGIWYHTPTVLDPYRVNDPNQARIHIHVVNYTNGSDWGHAWWSCSGNPCLMTNSDIYLYWPTILRNWHGDNTQLSGVIAHEFGHAFGLEHPGYCAQSIMVPGNAGCPVYYTPQQFDINDINNLYR